MQRVTTPIKYENLKPGKRLVTNNTRSVENEDGTFSIYLHDNLIAILFFDGSVRVFSGGGWKTKTTKQRLNILLNHTPIHIFSFAKQWMFASYRHATFVYFEEGTLITADGEIINRATRGELWV